MELWELTARESVRDAIARYNANGDAGRYDDVVALFTPDAVMELADRQYRGHGEIRTIFTGAAASFAAQEGFTHLRHLTATLQIDVRSTAEGLRAAISPMVGDQSSWRDDQRMGR